MPAEPVLRNFRNIEHRDALLSWRTEELVRSPDGRPLTRWDGRTKRSHPVTGEMVPDENARVEVVRLLGAQPARWPRADFIVGNPPFIGGKDLRAVQGEGYAKAMWRTYRQMPRSADYVMYWWHRAAQEVAAGRARRFGFITTNSLPQAFNRRVVKAHLEHVDGVSLAFAIPNHPWVDASDAADVRIAMTVGVPGRDRPGRLLEVVGEKPLPDGNGEAQVELSERSGVIHADLRIGADLTRARPLRANEGLCSPGVKLHGAGFIVTPEQAKALGLGRVPGLDRHIRPYLNGRDLTGRSRNVMVIDLFGLAEADVRQRFPDVYQWVLERMKPERDGKAGRTADADQYARDWWLFGKPRPELRRALLGLKRYIATVETAKHRPFVFLDEPTLPDNMLVCIADEAAFSLGVFSSRVHVVWTLTRGASLEDRPRYTKSLCFDPFPFPDCGERERAAIAAIAEELDGMRKERLRLHPDLTLTALYNVLAKLRSGEPLTETERDVHDRGLIGVLRRLHDDLDNAVFAAYRWPADISDDDLLSRLVALNRERVRGGISRQSSLAASGIPGRHRRGAGAARDRGGARDGSGAAILAAGFAGAVQDGPRRGDCPPHAGRGRGSCRPVRPRPPRSGGRGPGNTGLARAGARGWPRALYRLIVLIASLRLASPNKQRLVWIRPTDMQICAKPRFAVGWVPACAGKARELMGSQWQCCSTRCGAKNPLEAVVPRDTAAWPRFARNWVKPIAAAFGEDAQVGGGRCPAFSRTPSWPPTSGEGDGERSGTAADARCHPLTPALSPACGGRRNRNWPVSISEARSLAASL